MSEITGVTVKPTNTGAPDTYDNANKIYVSDGHLLVLDEEKGVNNPIAVYAPGKWSHAWVGSRKG